GVITAGSTEQSAGFSQVNQAGANLDQMTQQTAALVEESAAAAQSLREQAEHLAQVVSVFKVNGAAYGGVAPPVHVAHKPAPQAPRVPSAPAKAAVAGKPGTQRIAQAAPAGSKPTPAKAKAPAPALAQGADEDWESF
ncbi:MAG: methyl-accepting chemotaxis protein, partial [Acidovorax sp.]|nr:methyl-accepting chemotaxis protein [Acidovorax sp.]